MRNPLIHWVSFRVRSVLLAAVIISSILPPYVPASAGTDSEEIDVPSQQFMLVEDGFLMKTSTLGTQGSRLAYSAGIVHKVRDGDTVAKIAERYHISQDTVRWANNLTEKTKLTSGQELLILPVDGIVHVVRRGQTIGRIAQLYDIPLDTIVRQNKIKGGFIIAGEQLIIPGGKPIIASTIASTTQALQFGEKLPVRKITLPIPGAGGVVPQGPVAGAALTLTPLQMPCANCSFTQGFHPGHYAVDIQTKGGGPIYAAEDGTVIRADYGWNGGYGNVIEIDHGNGLVTLYGHNKVLHVDVGDKVQRGQYIADMGNTGLVHGPTGIHIHFEVRVNGVKKNPMLYLE
jgi:murein DD-endopeptidase MepM/ murein hydrolase activator NlpD